MHVSAQNFNQRIFIAQKNLLLQSLILAGTLVINRVYCCTEYRTEWIADAGLICYEYIIAHLEWVQSVWTLYIINGFSFDLSTPNLFVHLVLTHKRVKVSINTYIYILIYPTLFPVSAPSVHTGSTNPTSS